MSRRSEDPRTHVRGSSAFRPWLVFALLALALSLVTFRGLLGDPGGRVYAHNDDASLFIWWFANGADALASALGFGTGTTGFLETSAMNWPDGVNGAWNTSALGLALPLAPLTWLAGPVVAYTTAIVLSPVAASLAAAVLLTRFADRTPAFAGALLYGFSPYLIAQAGGHLNLSFAVLPPLVGAFLWRCATAPAGGDLRTRVREAVPWGILLGGVLGWQFYMSTELLAGTFLAAVVAVAAIAVCLRGRLRPRLLPFLAASGAAVVTALLLAAPLLVTMLTGPGAPREAIRPHGVWNNDLADLVTPSQHTLFAGAGPEIPRVIGLDPAEVGGYVSLVWLVVGGWAVVRRWRSPQHGLLVRVLALTGATVWLLSMGSPLRILGQEIPVPGPFRLVEHLPVLENILPMRLSVHVVLVLSALTAVLLHHALRAGRRAAVAPVGAVAAVAVLIAPAAVETRVLHIPTAIASGALEEAVPQGAVVKAQPTPRAVAEPDHAQAMAWQAETGMHYRETGGYFIGSTDDHDVIYQSLLDPLDVLLREAEGPGGSAALEQDRVDQSVRDIRARGTEFVLVPEDAPLLPRPADELAESLARTPGAHAELIEDTWVVDLRGVE